MFMCDIDCLQLHVNVFILVWAQAVGGLLVFCMFDVVLLLVVLDFIGICFFDKTTIYFYLIGLIDHAFVAHYVL